MLCIGVILAAYSFTLLLPLLWALITSFKSVNDYSANILGLPTLAGSKAELAFGNYVVVFKNFKFLVSTGYFQGWTLRHAVGVNRHVGLWEIVFNTLVYSVGGAIAAAIVPCVVGYLCAKYKFRFSGVLYAIVIFVMVMPIVGTIPARITLLRRLCMYDSLWGSIIEKLSFTNMYFLVFFAFFKSVPDSFAEAAEVDGASQLRILVSIMLPMAMKMLTAVALILFVQYWNDYNTPYLFMPTHPTLSYAVFSLVLFNNFTPVTENAYLLRFTPAQIAACMMLAVPVMIVFIIFKDKLMGNLSMGGIKG